jgi:hypothetical protein
MQVQHVTYRLYQKPLEEVEMIDPVRLPGPDDVLLGYERIESDYFVSPQPRKMECIGWTSVVCLAFLFWPAMCIPCCLGCSYPMVQRPVYGHPRTTRFIYIVEE